MRHTELKLFKADKIFKASNKKPKRDNRNTDYINQDLAGKGLDSHWRALNV